MVVVGVEERESTAYVTTTTATCHTLGREVDEIATLAVFSQIIINVLCVCTSISTEML
jgi:hypothetical protein